MKIDPQSPLPKYHQLKEIIKESSKKGMIKPNERIQSESELMTIYKISRHTVRHAMGDLVNEGWLYREPGIGTFCADRLSRTSKKTFIIGVISVVVSNYIFPSIIHGIDNVIHPKGYSIVLGNANHNTEKEAAHLQDMINRNVDGLIIEPTRSALPSPNIKYFHKLREKGIPFVMIDSYFDDSDLAILSEVPLTTVAHPKGKMGEKAGKMLLQLIESSSTSQIQQFVYKPQLIIRDSCKSMC